MKIRNLSTIASLLLGAAITGQAGDDSGKALILNDDVPSLVKITLDTRLRYEYADQDGRGPSTAATMRNRVGLLSKEVNGFQVFGEYEGTVPVDRSDYQDLTGRFPSNKTGIADPRSNELNQLWASYKTADDIWGLKVGRQGINLDGQRYVGTVAWRQNMQTYDAAALTWTPNDDLEVYYAYVSRVNRIFGSEVIVPGRTDFEGSSHLFNAKFKNLPIGTLTTYVYSLDLGNAAGDVNSSDSFGFSLAGDFIAGTKYYAEYAHQVDGGDSPLDYNANYVHTNLSADVASGVKATVGYEYLGSDNGVGYKFPLGTNHKFNGFADRFLATPAAGLSDVYASLATTVAGFKLVGAYHYFWDDGLDVSFGQEIDAVIVKSLSDNVSVLAKGAYFMGQNGQPDTTRASIEMNIKY